MNSTEKSLIHYFKRKNRPEDNNVIVKKTKLDSNKSTDNGNVLTNDAFTNTRYNGLNVSYAVIFSRKTADKILQDLESNLIYNEKSQVKIFGKVFDVPRKQTAFGEKGLSYTFSGVTVPAKKWPEILLDLKNIVQNLCKCTFNFVLVNRYENGNDYMGEHRDDEKDLDETAPIASLSFGQSRDFLFRHKTSRGGNKTNARFENKKMILEHGSLLIMHPPTNKDWYHSLPKRATKTCPNTRINLTFRKMTNVTRKAK